MKLKKTSLIIVITLLLVCMVALVVYAMGFNEATMDVDLETGDIEISLNDGKPILGDGEFNIEPNKVIVKDFTVKNIGTADCYYRLYLENVRGDLADVLIFEIYDESSNLLKQSVIKDFTSDNAINSQDLGVILVPSQVTEFTINAYLPKEYGNKYQNSEVAFSVVAEAIQSKNR